MMIFRPVLLVTILHTVLGGIVPPGADDNPALNSKCVDKCQGREQCFLRDENECGNYIHCERMGDQAHYRGIYRPCAFGTYWAGLAKQQKVTCDRPDKVVCTTDRCLNRPIGYKYKYDWNCKAYWECGTKGPEPKCCPGIESFNPESGECTVGNLCTAPCPIQSDACAPGDSTAPFRDENCRTYWDCTEKRPHPVCCGENEGYNESTRKCELNLGCTKPCPPEYKPDICQRQNTYKVHDDVCHTYMKCNAIEGDERWCCKQNYYYDATVNDCLPMDRVTPHMTCNTVCPPDWDFECHLDPVRTNRSQYFQYVHGNQQIMSCSPSTEFNYTSCGCGNIKKGIADDYSCTMELDILFDKPKWHRYGSQRHTAIEEIGTPVDGLTLNNRVSRKFDGKTYYRANFFKQSMPKLFIHVIFLAEDTSGIQRQDIVNNCGMLHSPNQPSLELYLLNNELVLSLVTASDNNSNSQNIPQTVKVPVTPGQWNQATGIYDGFVLHLFNQGEVASHNEAPLTGSIKLAIEGIDIAGCAESANKFEGSIARIQISKCLKPAWKAEFNKLVSKTEPQVIPL